DGALLDPGSLDLIAADAADALDFEQPFGLFVDHLERFHAEFLHQAFGHHLADPLHEPGAEVAFDADERDGDDGLEGVDLELLAEPLVVKPAPFELHALAGPDTDQVAHGRHRFAAIGHGDLDDAPRALFVGERHALEHPFEHGLVTWLRGLSLGRRAAALAT